MTREEFLQTLAHAFDLSQAAAASKAALLVELETCLRRLRHSEGIAALIVDEAQAMPDELLEEVRLLVNLETDTEKLLPLVLVGQPELAVRLNELSGSALKQRVTLRCELGPLNLSETAQYISARIKLAGGVPGQLFTREAVDAIYHRSGGIPRVISVICDNALLTGFALEQRPIGRKIIADVCKDFDFGVEQETPSSPSGQPPASNAASSNGEPSHPPAPRRQASAGQSRLFSAFTGSSKSWFSKLVTSR